ncbi:hypothetical protein CBS470a_009001 [Colletotrichum nupharicola]|nr:hypothetical protein CBS470a_009001 [Colletotrichum nupharicola]
MVCTKGKSFEDVSASSDPTVDCNFDLPLCDRGTFSQGIERSWNAIKLSAAMVRNEHAVNTMLDGQCNVVGGVD